MHLREITFDISSVSVQAAYRFPLM